MTRPLLVFDLDGTLADSAADLLATLNAVLPQHGFDASFDPELPLGIGHGARYLLEFALRRHGIAVDVPTLDLLHRDFLGHYEANICVDTRLYPGTTELLGRFEKAGWSFAVCTNKPVGMSRLLLEKLGVAERFAAICGGDSFATRKPDAGHLLGTIAAAGGARSAALMVGDSITDLDTARAAGVPMVGVTFGYTPVPMADLGPDLLIEDYDELLPDVASALLVRRPSPSMPAEVALP